MWIREQEKQFGKERLYHQLFHAAPNGMGIVDLNGRWLEVNSALCRLTGYSEKELLYSHFRAVPHAMDGEADAFYMERMLYHKIGQYQFEKSYIHKMGHLIHVIFSISLLRDKYENPLYYIVQLQDIGERKQMEERLFAYKEMYSAFIKNTTDAVAILDSEGHVLEVNEAYSRIFGWTREEVIGKRFPATPEECMQDAEYLLEKAVSGGVVQKVETVKRRKDGTWIDVSISMSPIRDSMGRVVAVSAMARDMTLQNKLWQTARESEDVFIRLMENSPEPFMISRDGIWVYGNNAALQLLGAAGKDQVIGKSVYDFIHPQGHETVRRRLACAEKGNIKGLIEQKMIRLDGTVIHVETVTIPAMFEGKPSIHTVIRDVTERKKAEEVLRTSDKLKAAGQMAAGIAHEIRNPLTAIKGFIQLAEWRLPDKVEYFSIIKEEIERIERITSELLMLAKPNPGKVQKTDIRQILQGVKALLETQAIMNKIEIVTELQETPAYIECDENQIKQVFINLIKNAIEAMKQGGTITVSVRCEDGKVLAEVADQGCGIPQEQLLKIGQPFYTTKDKGTGLGLMVSFKIIENHHGSISISSRSGEGTTFTIALPLACGQT